jgi:hypothetical protein
MKRFLLLTVTAALLGAVLWLARGTAEPQAGFATGGLRVQAERLNPWTHLRPNNDPSQFQFAVVSDRTGGHRAGVFSRAVEQLNLLQPEFVLSVGDLIEGGPDTAASRADQWREFRGYVEKLQMPFFFVPGNHDVISPTLAQAWDERFGRRYYHFLYQDVLFVVLNPYEGPPVRNEAGQRTAFGVRFSDRQQAWLKQTLSDNARARWTLVFVHAPVWNYGGESLQDWLRIEALLKDRPYTVFCGHIHRYCKYVRQGRNYYQLATTGGGSGIRGPKYGEFDHVAWVTMKPTGPVLANLLLDGVYPDELQLPVTQEGGARPATGESVPVVPVSGRVTLEGKPLTGVLAAFSPAERSNKAGKAHPAVGVVEADGSFRMTTFRQDDGVQPAAYVVTFTPWRKLVDDGAAAEGNPVPAKYRTVKTSDLTVEVRAGELNTFRFDLKK